MTHSEIAKALADSERSYSLAKASVSAAQTEALLARGPSGIAAQPSDLSKASEQLQHFRGWVYSSIRPIAQRIAGQPIHVGRMRSRRRLTTKNYNNSEQVEELESHPLLDLLCDPNELQVAWSLMFVTVASLELTGRSLWWLPEKKQILPVPISWLIGMEGTTSYTGFKIRPPGTAEEMILPSDQCVYFAYPNPADPHGACSPLQACAAAVDCDDEISRSQAAMFRNGINPSVAILLGREPHPDMRNGMRPRLTNAQQRQVIEAVRKRYAGTCNHHEPLILDGMIEDVKQISNKPGEMDWLNSGKMTKAKILQTFGVNPIIMGEIEGANRASAFAADKHFVETTINPKIELLSQTLTEWLRPMFGQELVIWIEPCVANDAEMELKRMELAAKHLVLTANELRQFAGLPALDELEGQLVSPAPSTQSAALMESNRFHGNGSHK